MLGIKMLVRQLWALGINKEAHSTLDEVHSLGSKKKDSGRAGGFAKSKMLWPAGRGPPGTPSLHSNTGPWQLGRLRKGQGTGEQGPCKRGTGSRQEGVLATVTPEPGPGLLIFITLPGLSKEKTGRPEHTSGGAHVVLCHQ